MRALIAGGGIAGTVCALALHKAGIEVNVCEASKHETEGAGAFVALGVNGQDALRAVDVDPCALGGFETPRMAWHLGSGRKLAELNFCGARADGLATRAVLRSHLCAALRDEARRRGIRIYHGKRVVNARRLHTGSVVADFSDHTRALADVLVGGDGIASAVRRLIDPQAPKAQYAGLVGIGGVVRGVAVQEAPGTLYAVFGKRCFFACVPAPEGEVWWFIAAPMPEEPKASELAAITPQQWRDRLCRLVARDRTPAADLVRMTQDLSPAWPLHDLARVPAWQGRGMVLVGDAAHPVSALSAQGASLAIEDAVTLARCLRDVPGVDAALADYEARRRSRVERIVQMERLQAPGKAPEGFFGRVLRDFKLRAAFGVRSPRAAERMQWVFDHHIGWER